MADGAATSGVIYGTWPTGTAAGTYFVAWNKSGTLEVLGKFIVPANVAGTFAIRATLPPAAAIAVYNGVRNNKGVAENIWSPGSINTALTATLNYTDKLPTKRQNLSGAVG